MMLQNTDQFTVNRHNLVFKVPDVYSNEIGIAIRNRPIDTTFELQLRSILSEGWHEVDHDLRYKSKSNWINQGDLSRALNGIMATLETRGFNSEVQYYVCARITQNFSSNAASSAQMAESPKAASTDTLCQSPPNRIEAGSSMKPVVRLNQP